MNQRALLFVNAHARRGQANRLQAIEQLHKAGLDVIEASTHHPQQISDFIRQYQDQVTLVIIGGGDGTLNAAIEGLVDTQLPLGILPLGTANDLARTLGIPESLSEACKVITEGNQKQIDLGWVNGKHFLNVASLGLSVQITRQLDQTAKRRWGVLAYALTALQVLWRTRPFSATLLIDGQEQRSVRTVQIAVGNGRYYGGGLTVAAEAAIDDRLLDVYSLNIHHWWQMLPILPAMRLGHHTAWPFVEHIRCQAITVETHRQLSINTDGELTTHTPAQFRVVPAALSVFAPVGSPR